ncbi:hypothetical protein AB1Y20_009924 [Prymnesium parvum]|uniref:Glycerophosphocholine acyltransferase 1 n=1 Tax=Prymnesium parvum TaxID=97485 RepID=A0AB34K5V7_PRYPA
MERRSRVLAWVGLLAVLMWICVFRIGLKALDVALVYAVGGYAFAERRWEREKAVLLGEDASVTPVRWWDFVCDQHQLLGCLVKGRRSRSERFLALAVTTLALLYWKAIFRTTPVKMSSLQGLCSSLWTLMVSKTVQQLMKQAIRFYAQRTARANKGWMEALQMHWQIAQYWAGGFVLLCIILIVLEGRDWYSRLWSWMVNMAFALVVVDMAFCYIKFKLLSLLLRSPLRDKLPVSRLGPLGDSAGRER